MVVSFFHIVNIQTKILLSTVPVFVFFLTTIPRFILVEFVWWLQEESLGRLDLD